MGDTAFGAMVEAFSGDSTGPLVEPPAAHESTEPDLSFWDEPDADAEMPPISDAESELEEIGATSSFAPSAAAPPTITPEPKATAPVAATPVAPAPVAMAPVAMAPIAAAPVIPTPAAPPLPLKRPVPVGSQGFDLDDGFFNTDLSTAGILIEGAYGPGGAAKSASTGAAAQRPSPSINQVPPPAQTGATGHAARLRRLRQRHPRRLQRRLFRPRRLLPIPRHRWPRWGASAPFPASANFEHFLGGMPVTLQDIPRPQHFGHVSVSFGDKSLGVSHTAKAAKEGVPDLQNVTPPPKYQPPKPAPGANPPPFATQPVGITDGNASVNTLIEGLSDRRCRRRRQDAAHRVHHGI